MATTVVPAQSRIPWWIVLLLGIAYIIAGLFLVFQPLASLVVIALFTGATWFVSGVLDLISLFRDRTRWVWTILSGVIGIWAGLVLLGQPLVGGILLPAVYIIILALSGVVLGILRIVQGVQGGGLGVIIWGAVTTLLAGWLLLHPLAGVVVLPFVFGIFAIIGGILTIIAAFQIRQA
ncbi:MAG: DUF308 domain-containing protein [Oscillochloridaceae bacterium]|nr:DUF308 domain-containing protein [Chloroflexaceae bacterium]MDW8389021.1 DUF308 domain-containing protein [Oscillochloridaceae bacterium]